MILVSLLGCDPDADRTARVLWFDSGGVAADSVDRDVRGRLPVVGGPPYGPAGPRRVTDSLFGPAATGDPRVQGVPDGATSLGDDVLLAIDVRGPVSAAGVLLAEVFVRPPRVIGLDACVVAEVGSRTIDRRPLADGAFVPSPGAEDRPVVRHRVIGLPTGIHEGALDLRLEDCSDATIWARARSPVPWGDGLPDLAGLAATGTPLGPSAATPEQPPRFRATADGWLPLEAPLPPVRVADARAITVTGAVDPTRLAAGGLAGLATSLVLAPAIVPWDAPVTVHGRLLPPDAPFTERRRVDPSAFDGLAGVGVVGVALGAAWVDDAGPVGRSETVAFAAAAGLVPPDPLGRARLQTADGAPPVGWIDARSGGRPALDGTAWIVLDDAGLDAARSHVDAGASAVIDLSGALAVTVHRGVPIVTGLPPLIDGAAGPGVVARVYVDAAGASRVDLLLVAERSGAVHRDDVGAGRALLVEAAARSEALGAELRVGRMMAALDVRAHAPPPAVAPDVPPVVLPAPPPPPDAGRPSWCDAAAPPADLAPHPLGGAVEVRARVVAPEVPLGMPIEVELWWRALAPLPSGLEVAWSAVPAVGPAWRTRTTPCEGTWPFDAWEAGSVVHERVRLPAPRDAALGAHGVSFEVRSDTTVLRPDGGRRVAVGSVEVSGSEGGVRAGP